MSDLKHRLIQAAKIDDLASESLIQPSSQLSAAIKNSQANNIPPIAISALQGQYLAIQAQLISAKNILEIGTLGGYSTIHFAQTGAHVTSLEINPHHKAVAEENCKGLDVEVILGPALETLPKLKEQRKVFDFVFIDADWGEQWEYYQWAVELTRKNGLIYVDNVVRELLESDPELEGKGSLLNKIGSEKRAKATLIQTVSGHKEEVEDRIDGFVLAVVL